MEIKIDYYKLIDDKKMGDGEIIPHSHELTLIKEDDDGLLFFETNIDGNKKFFWTLKAEVDFFKSSQEKWSEEKIKERNNHINGEFL